MLFSGRSLIMSLFIEKTEPQMKRRLSVIQRIYFYVLAFNEEERTKNNFFIFFSIIHSSYQYCIKSQTDRNCFKTDSVLRMLYKECSERSDG